MTWIIILSISRGYSRLWAIQMAGQPVNVGRFLSLRIPCFFHHFSGMEAPTEIYVGTGLALGALVLMLVNWRHKPKQRPEDGFARAGRRERAWYGSSEQNKDFVPIPFESPLSEGKLHPERALRSGSTTLKGSQVG